MHFGWVKGQAGLEGNELVDRLAKEAAVEDGPVVYDKIPREVIITQEKENGIHLWQQQWTKTGKKAVTKAFFPISEGETTTENCHIPRVYNNGNRTWEIKIILHRFGLTDNPICSCEEEQTTDHLIFQCNKN
jgi:hypothetical protein